jgi:CPA2 family monovalent cation:H+ antiporter-2
VHEVDLILTLTGGLTAALVLGYITQQLKLSPIVGYLLAGIAVGPHTPWFEADHSLAQQLAEVGVILLMFGVGLNFHVRELLAVRGVALPGALVAASVATLLGMAAARLAGNGWATGIVFGGAISVASTVVLIRVLSDNRDLHTRAGHIAVGWVVVEDLLTVTALVVLPAMLGEQQQGVRGVAVALATAAFKIAALVTVVFLAGGRIIPWLMERIAATRSRELFTLAVLSIALGIAVGSAKLFGVSMALGAFLAGTIVGRSDFGLRAASEALPMRDAFAVLFFVSVGMLFDPSALLDAPWLLLATLAIVLVAKPLTVWASVLLLGCSQQVAVSVAISLAQIGEFSFILAALGRQLGVLPDEAVNTLVAAAIASITLNPLLYRLIGPIDRLLASRSRAAVTVDDDDAVEEAAPHHRAIVVGYGPVGQTVTQLLLDNDIEPTVIELNLETVRRLKAFDVRAIYGDAIRPEILTEAGIKGADNLILTSGSSQVDEEIVRAAKELNPQVKILARSQYVRELPKLRRAGAEDVFSAEGEVALAFTARILERLGATGEQIDRERARVEATFRHG